MSKVSLRTRFEFLQERLAGGLTARDGVKIGSERPEGIQGDIFDLVTFTKLIEDRSWDLTPAFDEAGGDEPAQQKAYDVMDTVVNLCDSLTAVAVAYHRAQSLPNTPIDPSGSDWVGAVLKDFVREVYAWGRTFLQLLAQIDRTRFAADPAYTLSVKDVVAQLTTVSQVVKAQGAAAKAMHEASEQTKMGYAAGFEPVRTQLCGTQP